MSRKSNFARAKQKKRDEKAAARRLERFAISAARVERVFANAVLIVTASGINVAALAPGEEGWELVHFDEGCAPIPPIADDTDAVLRLYAFASMAQQSRDSSGEMEGALEVTVLQHTERLGSLLTEVQEKLLAAFRAGQLRDVDIALFYNHLADDATRLEIDRSEQKVQDTGVV